MLRFAKALDATKRRSIGLALFAAGVVLIAFQLAVEHVTWISQLRHASPWGMIYLGVPLLVVVVSFVLLIAGSFARMSLSARLATSAVLLLEGWYLLLLLMGPG